MAEQFTLQQVLRQCRAVDGLKRLTMTFTVLVNGPGNKLFSGPGFPHNQDRRLFGVVETRPIFLYTSCIRGLLPTKIGAF
jgi:hypothetical protein